MNILRSFFKSQEQQPEQTSPKPSKFVEDLLGGKLIFWGGKTYHKVTVRMVDSWDGNTTGYIESLEGKITDQQYELIVLLHKHRQLEEKFASLQQQSRAIQQLNINLLKNIQEEKSQRKAGFQHQIKLEQHYNHLSTKFHFQLTASRKRRDRENAANAQAYLQALLHHKADRTNLVEARRKLNSIKAILGNADRKIKLYTPMSERSYEDLQTDAAIFMEMKMRIREIVGL